MGVVVTDAEVTPADVLSLRMTIEEPLAAGAELVLRHRGSGAECRVTLGAPEAGKEAGKEVGKEVGVAVSLGPLALVPGRWDAYLQQDGPRTRLQSVDPGFSLDRLDAYALDRRTMAYRAYRTRNGYLAIKIVKAAPVADVRAVWFREGRFEVTGLLAYTGLGDDDRRHHARLALRSREAEVGASATVRGVRFYAALSLCDVLDAAPDSEGVWEPTLEVEGLDGPLALAAGLDDVEGKRRRVHYPSTRIDGVPIKPSYTADDQLRLEVGAGMSAA